MTSADRLRRASPPPREGTALVTDRDESRHRSASTEPRDDPGLATRDPRPKHARPRLRRQAARADNRDCAGQRWSRRIPRRDHVACRRRALAYPEPKTSMRPRASAPLYRERRAPWPASCLLRDEMTNIGSACFEIEAQAGRVTLPHEGAEALPRWSPARLKRCSTCLTTNPSGQLVKLIPFGK